MNRRTPAAPVAHAALAACVLLCSACHHTSLATPQSPGVVTIANVGFSQPENLVYDSASDVYLVSNMGPGDPAARDDNGFISRVSPDGRVLALLWIAGGRNGVVLDAPKGLTIHGDTLVVADVGGVHLFNLRTGAPLGTITLPGVVMNDVAYAPDGSLWITDTGPNRTPAPVDTTKDLDAVWRVDRAGHVQAVARGLGLGRPDGIVLDGTGALISTFGANRIERVGAGTGDNFATHARLPAGRVDGLRRLPDGHLITTSWDAKAVWRLDGNLAPHPVMTNVTSPAGVAIDARRHRVAITSMQTNTMYLVPLG